jgi:predicted nucleic acid-binding protein
MKPKPSARVVTWVARQSAAERFTTSITEAEIFFGIELLAKSKRREGLLAAAEAMFAEDLGAAFSGSRVTQREIFLRLQLTAVRSADLSARRMGK